MSATYDLHQLKVSSAHFINYTYIIVDKTSGRAAIVDPAWELELILRKILGIGAKPEAILLTHSHYDHVNLVDPLVEQFDSQVFMSKKEIDYYHFRCQNLNPVEDFDTIQLGETSITSLLTPGHTAGGTCYQLSESLFTGDTVFIEGCGICDTIGGSPDQMFDSIQKIKRHSNPDVRIYPGHSYGLEPGYPLKYLLHNNIYFIFEKKEQFIAFRMRKNQKKYHFFGNDVPPFDSF
ncbi:MBL fold metallo-hydrolase [Thermoflavimicrobium dichotomicum]|uniref:Glyoxylase, beta-lactamase superfamily II n=1 Tax=Thermoflavimicrobium dichotomicum TaxID=46223 RepID=A0A1I3TFT6_9BACL|nr:MBL fold metallo-hydrolase [Thermoflavimicrobium dichotomicum]SFJ70044.1 Glyoxylase, beta-lactamase superfamily II [Thermoflavimicrobium dichotomicum]